MKYLRLIAGCNKQLILPIRDVTDKHLSLNPIANAFLNQRGEFYHFLKDTYAEPEEPDIMVAEQQHAYIFPVLSIPIPKPQYQY